MNKATVSDFSRLVLWRQQLDFRLKQKRKVGTMPRKKKAYELDDFLCMRGLKRIFTGRKKDEFQDIYKD